MNSICPPDYDNSLVNLSNSFLRHFDCPQWHSTLAPLDEQLAEWRCKNIILLVLDGMGMDMLKHNLPEDSFFRRHIVADISSVYPPTTTAATTSIYSGKTPKEHGMAGWQCYFKEYGKNIELFTNRDSYTQEQLDVNVSRDFLAYKKLYEQIREQRKYQAYGVAVPWGDFSVKDFDDICLKIKELCRRPGEKFILSYHKEPDHTMHRTGCYSAETRKIIKNLEQKVQKLCASLKDYLLVITADHGLLDIKKTVLLNEVAEINGCLRLPPAIEPRTVAFYLKDGKSEAFKENFNRLFGADYKLLTADEYLNGGWLGEGKQHPKLRDFIGDYVALATGEIMLEYQTPEGVPPLSLTAHHAGLTEKEMRVPLIVCKM